MRSFVSSFQKFMKDEKGNLNDLTWQLGSAVIVVMIIVGLLVFAPDTVETLWNDFVQYARGAFGF